MITALFQTQKKAASKSLAFKLMSISFLIIWIYFYAHAIDSKDWWIENILVIIFFTGIFITRRKFIFTDTSLAFIFLFLILHIYGAKMAYTQNELGAYLQNKFHLTRNPYDRIVHFSFGFLMLYPFAELVSVWFKEKMNFVLLFSNMAILCLATVFELIEWGVAAFTDKVTGETYVATQGDPWDAQKDIFVAIVGSLLFTGILKIIKKNNISGK